MGDNTVCSDDRAPANGDRFCNDNAGSNPAIVFDHDSFRHVFLISHRNGCITCTVISRKNCHIHGKHATIADDDLRSGIGDGTEKYVTTEKNIGTD